MPVFIYKAMNANTHTKVHARLEAKDKQAAKQQLREMGLMVQSISAVKDDREKQGLSSLMTLVKRVPSKQILIFSQQLSAVLEAGIPLIEALFILEQQSSHSLLRQVIIKVRQEVINGGVFSEAMAQCKVFDRLYISMLKIGEQTGELDQALNTMCQLIRRQLDLEAKVQKALTMPIISLVIILAVIMLMLVVVVPQFQNFFDQQKQDLPLITQILVQSSQIFQKFWWLTLLVNGGVLIAFNQYRLGMGKLVIDQLLLKVPVLGGVVTRIYTLRYICTLSTLISSGIILTEAMGTAAATVPNLVFKQAFKSAAEAVVLGGGIAKPLEKEGIMPTMVTKMMSVGEQSGEFEKMLKKSIAFMDEEVEAQLHTMTELIQPLMTLVLGGMLLFIFAAIYLPIFQIAKGGS
jgi:type IV pilus assembly protein PilC